MDNILRELCSCSCCVCMSKDKYADYQETKKRDLVAINKYLSYTLDLVTQHAQLAARSPFRVHELHCAVVGKLTRVRLLPTAVSGDTGTRMLALAHPCFVGFLPCLLRTHNCGEWD